MLLELTRQLQESAGSQQPECTPHTHPPRIRQQRAEHIEGRDQKYETKRGFDAVHPGPRFRQEAIADRHQQYQRRSDAQAKGKQHQPSVDGTAALGDIQQCRSQRSGHAGPDQQAGQHPECAGPSQATALSLASGLFQPITQTSRQLQLEETKHR